MPLVDVLSPMLTASSSHLFEFCLAFGNVEQKISFPLAAVAQLAHHYAVIAEDFGLLFHFLTETQDANFILLSLTFQGESPCQFVRLAMTIECVNSIYG